MGSCVDYSCVGSKGNVSMLCYAVVCQLAREMRHREKGPHLALIKGS